MTNHTVKTFVVQIFIAGPIEDAKRVLRAEFMREGLCATIEPTLYVYTGGEESGYVIGIRHYPRFPSDGAALTARARQIVELLLDATHQTSAMIVGPETTEWVSRRQA